MTEGPFLERAQRFLQELEWNALQPLKKRFMNLQQQQEALDTPDTSLQTSCQQILKAIEFLQTTFVVDLTMQILEAQDEPTPEETRSLPDPRAIVQEIQAILPASTMRLNLFTDGWQDRSPSSPPPIDPELLQVAKVFLQQLQSAQKPLKQQIHQLQTKLAEYTTTNPKKAAKLERESSKILAAIQLLQKHENQLLLQMDDAQESGIPFDMPPLGEIQQQVAAILSQK